MSASLSSIRSWQIAEGDMQLISGPLDKLGINYYNGTAARHDSEDGLMQISTVNVGMGTRISAGRSIRRDFTSFLAAFMN
ncbi:hypothetical protein JI735_17635 [Paenibacillus sonchi]|uniref:Uncharacterized protein n=1 Tax=Paenibacillus sonchi TaxID=373687 RepID=A0A974P8A2_9BACL|nr:hypothetical protein [Paenibacillus sonchi]QQZ58613.1 hypothetical protein JI735_17635 [Paenibacillus sonchi]